MARSRLYRGTVTMGLALPEAFANWQTPTTTELNGSYFYNLTPALVESGTKFELGNSTTDNTLTFASVAGFNNLTFYQPSVVYEYNRSTSPTAADQANIAHQLMAFPDTDFFAVLRVGKDPALSFAVGDVVSLVRVTTDWPVEQPSNGKNLTFIQTFIQQGDNAFGYTLAS